MNPRLKKEVRPLVLPWLTALLGAVLVLLLSREADSGQFMSFLGALGGYAFLGGVALVGSSAFGIELQHRTLSLLLTQPSHRARIWREKMLISGLGILSAALIGGAVHVVLSAFYPLTFLTRQEMAMVALFLLATACSCGFWTFVAGSIIGGVVFTIAAQFAAGLSMVFVAGLVRGQDLADGEAFTVLAVTALVYSVALLWLGRLKFIHLELKSARFGENAPTSRAWFPNAPRILTSRAQGWRANLVRKELRLQKPILQLAVVFVFCWLTTLLFQWFRPRQNVIYLFDVIACVYAPLCSLLAGCVSLGEEKALGVTISQQTLPVPAGVQWLVKLVVCFGTVVVLGLGLTVFFFWITGQVMDLSASGLMNPQDNGILALGCICGAVFLMSFWAISMFNNTVRAALVAVFGLIVVGACVALGAWCGQQNLRFELASLVTLMCHLQMPPDDFREVATGLARVFAYSSIGGIILLCLLQSFFQFRNAQAPLGKLLAYTFSLGLLISLLSLWSIDFLSAIGQLPVCGPVQELKSALDAVATKQSQANREQTRNVSTKELGMLSPLTETWLRNAVISCRILPPTTPKNGYLQNIYEVTVLFPNGRSFQFAGDYGRNPFLRRYGF